MAPKVDAAKLPFANDGSFLEQFLKARAARTRTRTCTHQARAQSKAKERLLRLS
jgi:hypothetical protein